MKLPCSKGGSTLWAIGWLLAGVLLSVLVSNFVIDQPDVSRVVSYPSLPLKPSAWVNTDSTVNSNTLSSSISSDVASQSKPSDNNQALKPRSSLPHPEAFPVHTHLTDAEFFEVDQLQESFILNQNELGLLSVSQDYLGVAQSLSHQRSEAFRKEADSLLDQSELENKAGDSIAVDPHHLE